MIQQNGTVEMPGSEAHNPVFNPVLPDDPEMFLKASSRLLDTFDQLSPGPEDGSTRAAEYRIAMDSLLSVIDNSLAHLCTDTYSSPKALTAVAMLLRAGSTPSRIRQLHPAMQCATHYHTVKEQLETNPHSPVLSVFVNWHEIDPHSGVTVQTARSNGTLYWRNDIFRPEDRPPEIVLGVSDPAFPTLSRSEERALLEVRHGALDNDVLKRGAADRAVIADATATVLTDRHDPEYLIPPTTSHAYKRNFGEVSSEQYGDWITDEFGIAGRITTKSHFVAVGEAAIRRFFTRFQGEVASYIWDSTPAGKPEALRIGRHIVAASNDLHAGGSGLTLGPDRNIRDDVWEATEEVLRAVLDRAGAATRRNDLDAPSLLRLCYKSGVLLDLNAVARRSLGPVRQRHESIMLTGNELLEAIMGELAQSVGSAGYYQRRSGNANWLAGRTTP